MKTKIIFVIVFCQAIISYGQTISSSVISTAGDYYTASGYTLSTTIGEPVIDNYISETVKLNTGFQQGLGKRHLITKLFLEGFFNGVGNNQANDENGPVFPSNIADKLKISLVMDSLPFDVLDTSGLINLTTNGESFATFPAYLTGKNYIVIQQRNHVETWSALPVSFANDTIRYDFTTAASKAFYDNQKEVAPGIFAFFVGDVNQDWIVNIFDLAFVFDMINDPNAPVGYITEDVNGDSVVNIFDLALVFDNLNLGAATLNPFTLKK